MRRLKIVSATGIFIAKESGKWIEVELTFFNRCGDGFVGPGQRLNNI